jgi:hypothetical protein
MIFPYPQPFSPRRRELKVLFPRLDLIGSRSEGNLPQEKGAKVLFPRLWERARVREVQGLNAKTYFCSATTDFRRC